MSIIAIFDFSAVRNTGITDFDLIRNKTSGTIRKMQFHLEHVFAMTDHHKWSI